MTDPADSTGWLGQLRTYGLVSNYSSGLAALLRILTAQKDYAVVLISGSHTLSYIPWIRDGMSMNSRLIIHQQERDIPLEDLLNHQLAIDIRLASHFQDVSSFTDDISQHKLDMVLVDHSASVKDIQNWLKLLSDGGLLICPAADSVQSKIEQNCSQDHFITRVEGTVLLVSRKGNQHRAKRGGRRR